MNHVRLSIYSNIQNIANSVVRVLSKQTDLI